MADETTRRGKVYRLLTLAAAVLMIAAFFAPAWWVSLEAPNYPKATFPDGIRIHFHMDSVRNGCAIRQSQEVEEKEALDCVHEMDTINHYVGMYPIASGGPVEKAYSPFLMGMLVVMALAFAAPGRKSRLAVSVLGYGAIAVWMGVTMYLPGGVSWQSRAYLQGLVDSLGQDTADTVDDANLAPIVRQLKESLAKSKAAPTAGHATTADASRAELVANLRAGYQIDALKKTGGEGAEWTGSGLQVLGWHYEKSLARWFNIPERNGRLARTMNSVAAGLGPAIVLAMTAMTFAAWRVRSPLYWLLVIAPAALPLGFLVEYSAWLWWYGHSLNEMGAFTLKPFMPTVFGDGKVAQFTTHSYPHYGFALMLASAAMLVLAALIRAKQLRLAGDRAEEV